MILWKSLKILLNGIIDFILSPCSCGFRSCHLLHRWLLLLSLCFPCGTHIIFIFQKNKCILTIKCCTLSLIYFHCKFHWKWNWTTDPRITSSMLYHLSYSINKSFFNIIHLEDVVQLMTFVSFEYNPSKHLPLTLQPQKELILMYHSVLFKAKLPISARLPPLVSNLVIDKKFLKYHIKWY